MKNNPPIASAPVESARNQTSCYDTESTNLIALNATVDDGRYYLLNYAQFLYAESSANPELGDQPDAPPERLCLHFATAQVVILGSGLNMLARAVQRGELKSVNRISQNYVANLPGLKTNVHSVTVTLKEDP
jgi:hypothetical protein